ncbi:MAG TPA: acyl-CoA dehydrogenase family protein [Nevskiaceae bacterium]|nr:acyl-CoA dehydrogenase family protein [Nevskiaceae bacterium]
MDFTPTADQAALVDAIDRIAAPFGSKPVDFHGFALSGEALERELADGEYFGVASIPEFGPVAAAMAVERLARAPYAAEVALSMLVRPHLPGEWPRPLAAIEDGRPGRFVATARTLILIDGDRIAIATPAPGDVEPVDSIFAYPMGRLRARPSTVTELPPEQAEAVRRWRQVALAAEASGLLQAAIDATVEHLSVRKQFGRPLGTFQALRHRMAECAVLAAGVRWLARKAASTGDAGDAAVAAFHAQDSATRVAYELHQMLGAMGMTLEHPLHLWTYRLKALLAEGGGRSGQARDLARNRFADD